MGNPIHTRSSREDAAMVDRKPPRSVSDERATLRTLLQYQRDSVVRKVTGVSDVDARRSPVPSGTSLLWLVKHLAAAETLWLVIRFAGDDVEPLDDTVLPSDTVPDAIAAYRATWARVDAIADGAGSLDVRCRAPGELGPANLRWVLTHLLEETARHAGHADLLRELLDGATGR
jgi:hypothetical protein